MDGMVIASQPHRILWRALVLFVLIAVTVAVPMSVAQAYSGYPTFDIADVAKDVSVTIQTHNLPADQTFTVRMGKIGTKAIGGEVVGTFDSGDGGAPKLTFNVPASLKGLAQIAIRMDSPSGYYAYNWFTNNGSGAVPTTTSTPSGTVTATPAPGYTGIPTFSITSVVADDSVLIKTSNFPAKKSFTVRMGAYSTKGIGGTVVGTVDSGVGGTFEAKLDIPDALKGSSRIAVRMDSTDGYFAYNWFWNSNTSASATTTPVAPGYTGIPTFTIVAVDEDASVTIKTNNFPKDQKFTVRMGSYGTAGIGGTVIGTIESGNGGVFESTFTIPETLKGSTRIAIRLENTSGFFAYNWFWNNDAP